MESNFGFIEDVQDQHFQNTIASKLYKGCANIEAQADNPDDAISLMRKYHEMVVRYLYDRLMGNPVASNEWTVSQALGNTEFRHKVGNEIFFDIAYKVQKFGNRSIHSDSSESENFDLKLTHDALLSLFTTEMSIACKLVDKLPPVQTRPQVKTEESAPSSFSGKVKFEIHCAPPDNDGHVRRYLSAELTKCKNPPSDLIYIFKRWVDQQTRPILQRGTNNTFPLPDTPDGTKYICTIISDATHTGRVESIVLTDRRKKTKKPKAAGVKEEKVSRNWGPSASLEGGIDSVVGPMAWPRTATRLFDSSSGLTHYFVRPDDSFVLNSLEFIGADVYLYRLLKREGYENIAFVEINSDECEIFAYDAQSERIFNKAPAAEKKGPQGTFGHKVSKTEAPQVQTPSLGRRRIRHFSRGEEFIKQVAAEMRQALRNPSQKSAIVMPISIFGKTGFFGDPIIDTLNEIHREGNYGNILLFTMPRREDIIECFDDNRPRMHSAWASNVVNAMRSSNVDIVQESIQQLLALGLIVLADEYQVDEIANLLLRKKIILGLPGFHNIPSTKMYALAELLLSHCMREKQEFASIPFIKRKEQCIRQLNSLLDADEVQAELFARSQKLKDVQTGYSSEVNSLQLGRVYHQYMARYENCNVEVEVLQEFDNFVGSEMEEIKSSILSAVRMFEDEQKHLQREKDAGRPVRDDDMPYMNFRFVGPPGSGKTSIATITAKYLNARKILPTSKVIVVNATELIRSHVGETAQLLRDAADRADGGVLIIDEFQGFESAYQGGNVAQDAMRAIVQIVNEKRNSLCIIAAGYEADVDRVFKFDDGAARRFPHTVKFRNYSPDSLMDILSGILKKRGRTIAPDALPLVKRVIEADIAVMGDRFGNAGYLKDMLVPRLTESLLRSGENRNKFTVEDVKNAFPDKQNLLLKSDKTADEVLKEFDSFVGAEMERVKEEIISAVNLFAYLRSRQDAAPITAGERIYPYMNMRFVGPPGAGKTSIAKLTAKYMNAKGILPRDSVEIINATELIRGEVGGTANLIREAADRANGGVLIIDEFHGFENAYQGGNIAKDAMNAITAILNKYGDTLCVIAAGYEKGVKKVLDQDDGVARRFPFTIHFSSYSVPTLLTIFDSVLAKRGMRITAEAKELLAPVIAHDRAEQGESFGNAGYLSDYLFSALAKQVVARNPNDDTVLEEDVLRAFPNIAHAVKAPSDSSKASHPAPPLDSQAPVVPPYRKLPLADFEQLRPPYPLESYTLKELGKLADPAILFITSEQGSGTAFLIHPDGYAVTCHHVIDGAAHITARSIGRGEAQEYTCNVVNSIADIDVALLKLTPRNTSEAFSYLPLMSKGSKIEKDDAIALFGFPLGERLASDISHDPGTIKSVNHPDAAGILFHALSIQAKHGNSGSPVVSLQTGEVVGILLGAQAEPTENGSVDEVDCMRPINYLWTEFFR